MSRIEHIDLLGLWNTGTRALILDLDNTLLAYGDEALPETRRKWVRLAQEIGFRLVVVSNNFPERVGRLGEALCVPVVPNALKPLPFAYLRALRLLRTPRNRIIMIGDQLLTDLLGAALLGIDGILTEPLTPRDFPLTRVLRWIERRILGRRFSA